jgi:hypothetical protein
MVAINSYGLIEMMVAVRFGGQIKREVIAPSNGVFKEEMKHFESSKKSSC